MTQTYLQIARQIASLQARADKQRLREIGGVVTKIKAAIEVYALTVHQLFDAEPTRSAVRNKRQAEKPSTKYSDGRGNTWGGRGPRPKWLREELRMGRTLSDFSQSADKIRAAAESAAVPPPSAPPKHVDAAATRKRRPAPPGPSAQSSVETNPPATTVAETKERRASKTRGSSKRKGRDGAAGSVKGASRTAVKATITRSGRRPAGTPVKVEPTTTASDNVEPTKDVIATVEATKKGSRTRPSNKRKTRAKARPSRPQQPDVLEPALAPVENEAP